MGNIIAKCKECFIQKEKDLFSQEMEKLHGKDLTLNESNTEILVKVEKLETTKKVDIFKSCVAEFFDFISEESVKLIDEIAKRGEYSVYAADYDHGFILKSSFNSNFASADFIEFLQNVAIRKSWDKYIESISIIPSIDPDASIVHYKFKKMLSISQREMTLISKVFNFSGNILLISSSYEESDLYEKFSQRLKIEVAGYYFEPLTDIDGKEYTKVTCLIKGDFGGPVPQSFIKKATAMSLCKFHESLEEAMIKYYQ